MPGHPDEHFAALERGLADSAAGRTIDLGYFTRDTANLGQVTWRAVYVKSGTPYPDEDTEFIPPGWYVMGEPSWDDETPFALHLDWAYDADGYEITEALAQRIAEALDREFAPATAAAAPPPSRGVRIRRALAELRQALAIT